MIPAPIATVAELWRYPVKSMRGEQLNTLEVLPDGIAHDRRYAIRSTGAPQGKPLLTGRERAALLLYTARIENGSPSIRTPAGEDFSLEDPALLRTLQADFNDGHRLDLLRSQTPLTDCRPIALLSSQTIAQLTEELGTPIDPRRFRANLLLTFPPQSRSQAGEFPEDALVGQTLQIGTAQLRITERDPRCRIVILDPETAETNPALMKLIDRQHNGRVGIYATVVQPGTIHPGDHLTRIE